MKLKFEIFLKYFIYFLIGLCFFSIPAFSFIKSLNFLIWIFTILLIISIFLYVVLFGDFFIDIVIISLLLFIISSIISSAFVLFKNFYFTTILNTLIIIIEYIFYKQANVNKKTVLNFILTGAFLFSLLFLYKYKTEILSLNFNRLGDLFGDINDICIILCIGFCLSFSNLLNRNKIIISILNIFMSFLFAFLSVTCGSKIAFLLILITIISWIIFFFGKDKWYFSIISIVISIVFLVVLLNFGPFALLKDRIIEMIYSIFVGKSDAMNYSYSTGERLDMFLNGMSLGLRRPLFGFGVAGFKTFSSYHNGWSHNHFSDSFCNYGLIGTILYSFPFILFFKNWHFKNKQINILMILFLVCTISTALFKEKFFTYFIGIIFSTIDCKRIITFKFNKELTIKKSSEI